MKARDRAIYWISTGILCAVMAFSAINFGLDRPFGPWPQPFEHLRLPDYLRIELSVAKALGVLALLIPAVPRDVKRFAYSGFAITLVSASIAHWSVGDDTKYVVNPLVFLGALIASYIYFNKLPVAAADRD